MGLGQFLGHDNGVDRIGFNGSDPIYQIQQQRKQMEDFSAIAQELVNTQRQIKQLEDRKEALKYQIIGYVHEHGAITCDGGKVLPLDAFEVPRLDQGELKYVLRVRFDITEEEADEIIAQSKVSGSRLPSVSVRLA